MFSQVLNALLQGASAWRPAALPMGPGPRRWIFSTWTTSLTAYTQRWLPRAPASRSCIVCPVRVCESQKERRQTPCRGARTGGAAAVAPRASDHFLLRRRGGPPLLHPQGCRGPACCLVRGEPENSRPGGRDRRHLFE